MFQIRLKDGNDLRPHGDHSEEQRERRQCSGLFGDGFDHGDSPERFENNVLYLFKESQAFSKTAG